jgi:nucleotide-binding universal stress UspA family protein
VSTFGNIVVGVGEDDSGRDALALARELSSEDGQLTLAQVRVVVLPPPPDSGGAAEDRRRAEERLAALRDASRLDARVVCVDGRSVGAGLHALAADRAADLLVIGTSRRDELERLSIGDDSRAVLENAPCAVAVAPVGYAAHPPHVRRIGAGYDGSPEGERALALARELAAERGADVSAFQALRESLYAHDPWVAESEIEAEAARARTRMAGLGAEPHVGAGDPAEELARYGASVDLLVLGSHRYRPIEHLAAPSTAQRLAQHPPCPLVVLAKPDTRERP